MRSASAPTQLRILLAALTLWNVGCGVSALVWPEWVGQSRGAEGAALHYIRVLGLCWLFVALMEGLGAWDLDRFLVAAQLAILIRLPTGLFHIALLIRSLAGHGHPALDAWFGLGDLAIFALGAWLLRRAGHRLLG